MRCRAASRAGGCRATPEHTLLQTRSETASSGRTRIFISKREPRRLMIDISRSTVNRPRSALRILEKSAAAMPVRLCAARTVNCSLSRTLMISAAKMALNYSTSAFWCPRSRYALRLPRTSSCFSLFIAISPSARPGTFGGTSRMPSTQAKSRKRDAPVRSSQSCHVVTHDNVCKTGAPVIITGQLIAISSPPLMPTDC
jgi:hypothetical protein